MFGGWTNWVSLSYQHKEDLLNIAIILLILDLLLGGVGLFVEALRWILIIALVLLLVGAFTGWRGRSHV